MVENANALANAMQKRGFNILTGGTDNHVFLVDLREAGITGKDAQARMDSINVTLNKNGIPFGITFYNIRREDRYGRNYEQRV